MFVLYFICFEYIGCVLEGFITFPACILVFLLNELSDDSIVINIVTAKYTELVLSSHC